ncbi:hypothetical protein PIROE2DRAFT_8263 [Piromyces sp. E2]|nr:hypothetical protein PIROE2DRAFT_8263 [Piromyces sp. E2]|eukprot:OUM64874.1 hypothetical protein PIROE2DRAFT_8263 [Piromyces sp. E2]
MKTIYFDLDDTLFFRKDAFSIAFDNFFQNKYSDLKDTANDRCRIRGDEVFYQAQNETITTEENYIYRYQKGFSDVGIEITKEQALEFYNSYQNALDNLKLNPDVISMLQYAKANFEKLGIITNGESSHQRDKIKNLGLDQWIDSDLIVISGEHGCAKPDKHLFEIAAQKANKKNNDLIIIGDSLQNDIIPAYEMGWHTIWINLYEETTQPPEYEVKYVKEIQTIFEFYKDVDDVKTQQTNDEYLKDEADELLESCEREIEQNNFDEAVKKFKAALSANGDQTSFFFSNVIWLLKEQEKINFTKDEIYSGNGITPESREVLLSLTDQDIKSALEAYAENNKK